jgi:hypothetical protein
MLLCQRSRLADAHRSRSGLGALGRGVCQPVHPRSRPAAVRPNTNETSNTHTHDTHGDEVGDERHLRTTGLCSDAPSAPADVRHAIGRCAASVGLVVAAVAAGAGATLLSPRPAQAAAAANTVFSAAMASEASQRTAMGRSQGACRGVRRAADRSSAACDPAAPGRVSHGRPPEATCDAPLGHIMGRAGGAKGWCTRAHSPPFASATSPSATYPCGPHRAGGGGAAAGVPSEGHSAPSMLAEVHEKLGYRLLQVCAAQYLVRRSDNLPGVVTCAGAAIRTCEVGQAIAQN